MMASLGKFENFQFSALINCYFFIFNRALRKHSLLAAFEILLTKHGKLYLLHSCECREKFARWMTLGYDYDAVRHASAQYREYFYILGSVISFCLCLCGCYASRVWKEQRENRKQSFIVAASGCAIVMCICERGRCYLSRARARKNDNRGDKSTILKESSWRQMRGQNAVDMQDCHHASGHSLSTSAVFMPLVFHLIDYSHKNN